MTYKPSDFIYYEMVQEALKDEANILEDDVYLTLENARAILFDAHFHFKEGYCNDCFWSIADEFRYGGEEYNLDTKNYPRHYEIDFRIKEITAEAESGETISRWIGWNYYYGGGKHACPEDVDWISSAEFVKLVSEEVVTVTKRTFEREE